MPVTGRPGIAASDDALTALSRRGDVAAFDVIVRRHRAELLHHALRRLADREAALDCVQEALLRAWESLLRFREQCSLQTWVHRNLENVCLEEQSRRARHPQGELLTECASASDVSAEVIARQEVLFALKAMARLPMGLRATALLNLVEGLSSGEAAGILGISEEAARMRLSRARALMAGLSLRPDEALSARTSLAEGYHFLAGVLLRQGKEAQSDRAILRALDFNNESAYDIWTNQVLARGLPHEVAACEQAIRVARDAVDRQPEDPWRLLVMGNLEYWERENYQAAERLFHAAAADRGGAGRTARLHLGHLYTHTDRPRQALSVLEPLVRQYPSPDFAVARTAYSLALCGEPAAREWAERARAVAMSRPIGTPRNNRVDRVHAGHLRLLAARCFEILGDVRQAAACFGAAEGAFPADWRRRPPGAP